jgi:hypothetical protein
MYARCYEQLPISSEVILSITERAERLAANLLADRQRERPKHNIIGCWSCGQTFVYRGRQGAASVWIGSDDDGHASPDTSLNGNFCSQRCQDWHDDGNPTYEQQCERERKLMSASLDGFAVVAGTPDLEVGSKLYQRLGFSCTPMRRGSHGFYIACKHCNKEFESLGLRCCSTDCERAYRESQERLTVLKEAGIEPSSRRMCERVGCDRPIPKWKNGRQVSAKVRFCSDLCRKRSAKAA